MFGNIIPISETNLPVLVSLFSPLFGKGGVLDGPASGGKGSKGRN